MNKKFLLSLLTGIIVTFSFAQNVGINADGSLPNSSAMLDVKSINKGMLIPRVALTGTADVTTIPSPATSLMVYNTLAAGTGTTAVVPGYYYWNGTAWVRLVESTSPTNSAFKTLIPFASLNPISLTNGVSNQVGLIGFGNSSTTTLLGPDINLANGPNFAFVVPASGIISDVSGFFSSSSGLGTSASVSIIGKIYISSTPNSNNFTLLSSFSLFPIYLGTTPPGTTATGTLSGLNIPVAAGSRLMMVVSANSVISNSISGYFSGGINMVIQ